MICRPNPTATCRPTACVADWLDRGDFAIPMEQNLESIYECDAFQSAANAQVMPIVGYGLENDGDSEDQAVEGLRALVCI